MPIAPDLTEFYEKTRNPITPRTDAFYAAWLEQFRIGRDDVEDLRDFARELERELNAATRRISETVEARDVAEKKYADLRERFAGACETITRQTGELEDSREYAKGLKDAAIALLDSASEPSDGLSCVLTSALAALRAAKNREPSVVIENKGAGSALLPAVPEHKSTCFAWEGMACDCGAVSAVDTRNGDSEAVRRLGAICEYALEHPNTGWAVEILGMASGFNCETRAGLVTNCLTGDRPGE